MSCVAAFAMMGAADLGAVACLSETSSSVTLPLAQSVYGEALVIKKGALTAYLSRAEVLDVFRQLGVASQGVQGRSFVHDIENAWPPSEDISIETLLERLRPPEPDHPQETRSQAWRKFLRETRETQSRLDYAFSELMERGLAAVRNAAGVPLSSIVRINECGTFEYRTASGEIVLRVVRYMA